MIGGFWGGFWNKKKGVKNMNKHSTHEQQVMQQGRAAYERGAPLTANPYLEGTNDAKMWELGWLEMNRKSDKKSK